MVAGKKLHRYVPCRFKIFTCQIADMKSGSALTSYGHNQFLNYGINDGCSSDLSDDITACIITVAI